MAATLACLMTRAIEAYLLFPTTLFFWADKGECKFITGEEDFEKVSKRMFAQGVKTTNNKPGSERLLFIILAR